MAYLSNGGRVAVFGSEEELEGALNTVTFSDPYDIKAHGGKFTFMALDPVGETISPEAQLVLDRMTSLTATERRAIIDFVNAEGPTLGNGNWDLVDEFYCFSLGLTNNLTGFINKTATAINAPTFDIKGATFNGVDQTISTNWIASVDGINYVQDDCTALAFVHTNENISPESYLFSANRVVLKQNTGNTRFRGILNTITERSNNTEGGVFANNSLYGVERKGVSGFEFLKNGLVTATPDIDSETVSSTGISLGLVLTGTLSSFLIGGAIGFDQVAHNSNLREFLTELGTIP